MEDIFDFNLEDKTPEMSSDEFVNKTKALLNKITNAYWTESWYDRRITDEEYKIAPCEGCKGDGCFVKDDIHVQCVADKEEGVCYEKCFDEGLFAQLIKEEIIEGYNSPIYDLINCKIKKENII